MKVLKFGGTSVGTEKSILQVKKIVEENKEPVIVVVSALGGITDKLILCGNLAAAGDESYKKEWDEIAARHFNMIRQIISPDKQEQLKKEIESLLNRLLRILQGVELIGSLPEQTLDHIVSFGENMSSRIAASLIDEAIRLDSLEFIKTEKWHGKNIAETELTNNLIKEKFPEKFKVIVAPGFISTDKDSGIISNLGRGGSDFTGALIAAALEADVLEIWTDVNGFMTADPRIIPEAKVIDHLTFTESMELCTFGAKVIYPPTIYPVFHKNIPIRILNTHNSSAPGTLITDTILTEDWPIKGVTPLKNIATVSIISNKESATGDTGKRALNILSKNSIRIFPLSNPDPDVSFSFGIEMTELNQVLNLLNRELAPEIASGEIQSPVKKENLTILAIVGNGIKADPRLPARIINSLRREGIVVEASSENSESTLSFYVAEQDANKALTIIHNLLF